MRDPSVLDACDPRLSGGRERLREGRARAHRAAAGKTVRRDEGPHQGGRFHGAEPGRRRMPISSAIAKAGSIRSPAASRAAAGAEQVLLDGDALAAGKAFFQFGGTQHSPDHRLIAWSADDTGSEYDTLRVRDPATGKRPCRRDPRRRGRAGVDRGFIRLLLRAARRQSPSLARLSPSARHAGGRRRAGLRGGGQPLLRLARAARSPAASPTSRCTTTRPRSPG